MKLTLKPPQADLNKFMSAMKTAFCAWDKIDIVSKLGVAVFIPGVESFRSVDCFF